MLNKIHKLLIAFLCILMLGLLASCSNTPSESKNRGTFVTRPLRSPERVSIL